MVGCRTAPVHNLPRTATAVPQTVTAAEVSEAIVEGGRRAGWRVREVSPGSLRAEKTLRTHRALVAIDHDIVGFSITLLEADNLLYDGSRVHEAYNAWAKELEKAIQDELRFRFP